MTGAPGDGTCNNCHFGGTQTGMVDISGIVDVDNPIIPNKTYNVTVTIRLTSGVSTRAGFQFVALDGNSEGSVSTGTYSNLGTNVGTSISGSRTYAEHSGGENTSYSPTEVVQVMSYEDHHLNIFPNPAKNNECLFIDFISETKHPNAILRIYDLYGRNMVEDPQMYTGIQKGFNKFVIDIKGFPVGQYFLSIADEGEVLEVKSFLVGK